MKRTEVLELLRDGENSTTEFKRDEVQRHDLAKVIVSFLNLEGGAVLLGVDDSGRVRGIQRDRLDDWVAEVCRSGIEPPIVPLLYRVRNAAPERDILVVRVPQGPDKPYARVASGRRTYYIRVGGTSREASRDELERMYQQSGRLLYGLKPVPGAGMDALDKRRLRDYFARVLGGSAPYDHDFESWETLLKNLDLARIDNNLFTATINAVLLFGRTPHRYLPQSGVRAIGYPELEPDYATHVDQKLSGPLVDLGASDGTIVEAGLVEMTCDFVRRNTRPSVRFVGTRRIDVRPYPDKVVREAVVNALVHRDYSIAGTDVMLEIYPDRLEIHSPGKLPNTVTADGIRQGARYARNQTIFNIMRDYGHVDGRGMGVRNKIIPGMLNHNGTDPDLVENDHRFTVRLWNAPR